jgi:hypothetical protein
MEEKMKAMHLTGLFLMALVVGACATTSPAPAADGADLNGTWKTACGNKSLTTIEYAGLQLKGTYAIYADDTCTTPVAVNEWTGHSTIAGADVSGATKIDVHFDSFSATARTDEQAAKWSSLGYCEKTDWAVNVAVDVLGKKCQGFAVPQGGVSLDVYKVSGTTLMFGKGSTITAAPTESARPTALNAGWAFEKTGGAS